MSSRGIPVVAVTGFTVVDPDLHVLADGERILVWCVSRQSGKALINEPILLDIELRRDVEQAAGKRWATASAAWRAGFREGFTDEEIHAMVYSDQEADVEPR